MKQVMIKQGRSIVEDTPPPSIESGHILVQVNHSCISPGTEMSSVSGSRVPLWKKALKHPQKVTKAANMVLTQGLKKTKSTIQGKLQAGNPTGYSAAGTVLEVGAGIHDVGVGERVACAGAQYAHHAERILVPRNLVTAIPKEVSFAHASTVTLGAIALQGIRRAAPTLGETFVVIGLGILGQLTAQLLKINGCNVIGIDLERQRTDLAIELGIDTALQHSDLKTIHQLTEGHGADGVIITAASSTHEIISDAFHICRRKGRVVLVGDVGLHLKREDFYPKEIDFLISTSYGPGRYDPHYEEHGLDYPISYVRWTENRNMKAYLELLAHQTIPLDKMISKVYPIDQATEAYQALETLSPKPLGILLSYPSRPLEPTLKNPKHTPLSHTNQIRIALIGAGGFAKGMHLPHLQSLHRQFTLKAVVSRSGHNAHATAEQFNAEYTSTNYESVLNNPNIDALIITTRHSLHHRMVLQGLQAGKHVLVEKPLCLQAIELEAIKRYFQEHDSTPILLTGFNRRFAPLIQKIIAQLTGPMIINYRMNVGYLPPTHWTQSEGEGGRNIGEACHIYDLFTYLTNSRVTRIQTQSIYPSSKQWRINDNFVTTLQFEEGSVATLTYTALGSDSYPKEHLEIYAGGKVFVLENYKTLSIHHTKEQRISNTFVNKGHKEELVAFAHAIQTEGAWPIPLWQQIQATEISFAVETQLREQYVRD